MEKVFSTGQVAKIFQVAPRTVSKWFDSGQIKGGYRLPGSDDRRIPKSSLVAFAKQHGIPLVTDVDRRILFIGCPPALQPHIAEVLNEEHWQFRAVANEFMAGSSVIEWRPRTVVLDFALGNGHSQEIAKNLKKMNARTIVIGLVDEADGELILRLVGNGFDRVFQSPLDIAAIAGAIRELTPEDA